MNSTTPYILTETAKGIEAVNIDDRLMANREIFLTTAINAETSAALIKQLMHLEMDAPDEEVTLIISSPGGEVVSGLAVYDYLRLMSCPVKTVCIGTAASMGSILFLAGDKRLMLPHTKIMIHDPSTMGDYAGQKPDEIRQRLNNLIDVQKVLCNIIAERSRLSLDEVYAKTKYDTYFTAEEALDNGIATNIIERTKDFRHEQY